MSALLPPIQIETELKVSCPSLAIGSKLGNEIAPTSPELFFATSTC